MTWEKVSLFIWASVFGAVVVIQILANFGTMAVS